MTVAKVAKMCRVFGFHPKSVREADEVVDGGVYFDGWHITVGFDYVTAVIELPNDEFLFLHESFPHMIITGEELNAIAHRAKAERRL